MNIYSDYQAFYQGMESLKHYGTSDKNQKDTLIKYKFNTTDEQGNKVMDKMSREETLQALNDISSQYGENVIVEFSGDGLAALVESKKGNLDQPLTPEEEAAREAKQAAFEESIIHFDRSANHLPAYSGIYSADKAIASALENCSKEEQAFVYDIIRQNFLIEDGSGLTEEERQANIALGMKKAEYAAENFIAGEEREAFMQAMETIAKLSSTGQVQENGKMDYGIGEASYLGHGSGLTQTTNPVDMMRQTDKEAYAEYQKICEESWNNEDERERLIASMRYLLKWYAGQIKKNPDTLQKYERNNSEYIDNVVKEQKLPDTFSDLSTKSREDFLEGLKRFQQARPGFLTNILNRELASKFWFL